MTPFHSVLPEIAQREVRTAFVAAAPGSSLPTDEYAFMEYYCEDLTCDCRRVFIQVMARRQKRILASINCGWESESFYQKRIPRDASAPQAITGGSLDPINQQSEHAEALLELFQRHVLDDPYRLRLKRHDQLFREELRKRASPSAPGGSPQPSSASGQAPVPKPKTDRIPVAHQARFTEIAPMIEQFGHTHLDPELTGFALELWKRICRRKAADCLRGKPQIWAAAVE